MNGKFLISSSFADNTLCCYTIGLGNSSQLLFYDVTMAKSGCQLLSHLISCSFKMCSHVPRVLWTPDLSRGHRPQVDLELGIFWKKFNTRNRSNQKLGPV